MRIGIELLLTGAAVLGAWLAWPLWAAAAVAVLAVAFLGLGLPRWRWLLRSTTSAR